MPTYLTRARDGKRTSALGQAGWIRRTPRRAASQATVTGSTGTPAVSRSRISSYSAPCSALAKYSGLSHSRTRAI